MLRRNFILRFIIADDASLLRINQEDPPRLETPFRDNPLRRYIQHPGFRSEYEHVIICNIVTGGAETVAV